MNELKVIFSQAISPSEQENLNVLERNAITEEEKSEPFLRLWASHELYKWFELADALKLKTFQLRVPIKVDVYWNDQYEKSYIQKRVTKDLIFDAKAEYRIRLKKGIYVLKPFVENYRQPQKKKPLQQKKNAVNLSYLLNTVEQQQIAKVKFATPILYTGMKQ